MSRAAGVLTGWEVVQDLVARVASSQAISLDELGLTPEEWSKDSGHGEPRLRASAWHPGR
jgi:hypothetical protein